MKQFFFLTLYQPLYNLFIFLLALIPGHNVGLAIILLTILVRLALMPLKHRSLESQLKQKELQPEIKKIQEKHKDDRQAQSMAMMQFYKEKGANPASGCLLQLLQIPILIVLFIVFRNGIGSIHQDILYPFINAPDTIDLTFLWLKDITQIDHTFVLPVMAGVSQFLYSRALMTTMPQSGGPNDPTAIISKQMMYLFPVMTILLGRSFPAALSLYWVVGTLVDWWQQTHGMKRIKNKTPEKKTTISVRRKGES